MEGWCKERYNKDENNKLEGLHQKPDQMEETRWEGQNFSEVVAPQEEKEEEAGISILHIIYFNFKALWLFSIRELCMAISWH